MFLTNTTRSIQILLSANVIANQATIVCDYVDFTSSDTTPGNQLSNTNNTTAVTIVSAPAASTKRKVNNLTITNNDADAIFATIRLNDNGTYYDYINSAPIYPNGMLQFTDKKGWTSVDDFGNILTSPSAVDVQVFTENGTWYKPDYASLVYVVAVGGGGAGGGGQGNISGTIRAGGGGGGGAITRKVYFFASDLSITVPVHIAADTVGGLSGNTGAGGNGGVGNRTYFGNYLYAYGGGGSGGGGVTANTGGGGGGGAGGTGDGGTSTTSGQAAGGPVYSTTAGSSSNDFGAAGGTGSTAAAFGNSAWGGGGGGGGGATSTANGAFGGVSFHSASGGGGGGGINAATPGTATYGGPGGVSGLRYLNSNNRSQSAAIDSGIKSANGESGNIFYGGGGGAGGAASTVGTGSDGGDGGVPGGGGGGGGGGTSIGGSGGKGARGQVWVYSW